MSWKNSLPYFAYQTFRYYNGLENFRKDWGDYKKLKASWMPGRNSMVDESPWLTLEAIALLKDFLKPEHRVFEYGGGGSTLFFCKHAAFVATVENHSEWFETLQQKVREKGFKHWEGFFEPGESVLPDSSRNAWDPADYKSGVKGFEDLSFQKYACAIHQYEQLSFDVILVDGRARPSCVAEATPYLKKGGLMVLDNTERSYYTKGIGRLIEQKFDQALNRYSPCIYNADFTKTLVLRKK